MAGLGSTFVCGNQYLPFQMSRIGIHGSSPVCFFSSQSQVGSECISSGLVRFVIYFDHYRLSIAFALEQTQGSGLG